MAKQSYDDETEENKWFFQNVKIEYKALLNTPSVPQTFDTPAPIKYFLPGLSYIPSSESSLCDETTAHALNTTDDIYDVHDLLR